MAGQDDESTDGGFNFDDKHQTLEKNSLPVSQLRENFTCYAILTPDGQWHERGKMGWWGVASDEKEKDDWYPQMRRILAEHNDCVAVGCDLHI